MNLGSELEPVPLSSTSSSNETSENQFFNEMVNGTVAVPKASNEDVVRMQALSTLPDIMEGVVKKEELSSLPSDEICESTKYIGESSLLKRRKVQLYTDDKGPKLYDIKGKIVTPPLLPNNLPDAFDIFPIFGKPKLKQNLEDFQNNKINEFMGCVLNDKELEILSKYCSPDHLKTDNELVMSTPYPTPGLSEFETKYMDGTANYNRISHLCVVKKHKIRVEQDQRNRYPMKLKYRSLRLMPLGTKTEMSSTGDVPRDNIQPLSDPESEELQPGKDLIYTIRVYRPFCCSSKDGFARPNRGRPGLLSCEVSMCGRQPLSALRDRIACFNDLAGRLDVSAAPRRLRPAPAKDLFPSGYLFINNVFYVDSRAGCADTSAVVRLWARRRGLGDFPRRELATPLQQLVLRLGHPEVYVHQGNCEHIFIFSDIRLVNNSDPLDISSYPCYTAMSHNQTVYCMTCAEFSAKWLATGCEKVPFDPAFFCETCFHQYLYKDGNKIGDFKAFAFMGNEHNMLKSSA